MNVTLFTVIAVAIAAAWFPTLGDEGKKADDYPLTTCVVSGEDLGGMGDAVIYHHEGREVRFCCKDCKKDFLKDPAKYLAMLDKAAAASSEKKTSDNESEKKDAHEHHHH